MIRSVSLIVLVLFCVARADDLGDIGYGLRFAMKLYDDCQQKDGLVPCLKMKAITFFDRATRADHIPLGDTLTIVKNTPVGADSKTGRAITENEIEKTLPADSEERDSKLNNILFDRVAKFFSTHDLQISLPKLSSNDLEKGVQEGRGKMKKMMSMMIMGMAMKMAAAIPIAIGVLFLLAGKALIISKIALVLTLIIALKKILSQKNSHSHESGWQSSGGWDRRSLPVQEPYAHNLAYRGQIKKASANIATS